MGKPPEKCIVFFLANVSEVGGPREAQAVKWDTVSLLAGKYAVSEFRQAARGKGSS